MHHNIFSCILSSLNKMNHYNTFIFMHSKLHYVNNICTWITDLSMKLSNFREQFTIKLVSVTLHQLYCDVLFITIKLNKITSIFCLIEMLLKYFFCIKRNKYLVDYFKWLSLKELIRKKKKRKS